MTEKMQSPKIHANRKSLPLLDLKKQENKRIESIKNVLYTLRLVAYLFNTLPLDQELCSSMCSNEKVLNENAEIFIIRIIQTYM
jgi:hypothetical protein